ncbi:MAG: tRNA (guanosine(37)-N1)-methyltransferase TrmD, partial [Raineya sp.]
MRIDIITVLPDLLQSPFSHSILKRAIQKGLVEVHIHNLREYGIGKHRLTDDYQFGGGAGMVMMIEPIHRCISFLQKQRNYDEVIYFTPDGERFEQKTANILSLKENLIMLCGHYKGVDERVREHFVTKEISIG